MAPGASEVLGYATEALLPGQRCRMARKLRFGKRSVCADELGERVYLPPLLLLPARSPCARGIGDAGSSSVRRAVEEARTQQAPWLELLTCWNVRAP